MGQDETIDRRLREILRVVLGHDVTADASRATDASWDSLKHIQLIFTIEEELAVRFSEEEIPQLDSLSKLADAVRRHHAA
jgi:acyl carrier protein